MKSQAYNFYKILILLAFLSITINKYPNFVGSMYKNTWSIT